MFICVYMEEQRVQAELQDLNLAVEEMTGINFGTEQISGTTPTH